MNSCMYVRAHLHVMHDECFVFLFIWYGTSGDGVGI